MLVEQAQRSVNSLDKDIVDLEKKKKLQKIKSVPICKEDYNSTEKYF